MVLERLPSLWKSYQKNCLVDPAEYLFHIEAGVSNQAKRLGCRKRVHIENAFFAEPFFDLGTDAANLAKRNLTIFYNCGLASNLQQLNGCLLYGGDNSPGRKPGKKENDTAGPPALIVRLLHVP